MQIFVKKKKKRSSIQKIDSSTSQVLIIKKVGVYGEYSTVTHHVPDTLARIRYGRANTSWTTCHLSKGLDF